MAVCADHNCFEFRGYLAGLCTGAIIARKIFPKYLNHFFSTKKKLIWKSHLEINWHKIPGGRRLPVEIAGRSWSFQKAILGHSGWKISKFSKVWNLSQKNIQTIVATFKEKASLLDYMLRQYPLFFQVKNNRLQSFWTAQQCLLLAFIKHFPVSFKFKDLDG